MSQNLFIELFVPTTDKHVPLKNSANNKRINAPWWDAQCAEAKNLRKECEKNYNKNMTESNLLEYLKIDSQAKKMFKKKKRDYFLTKFSSPMFIALHSVKILPGATVCEDCTLVGDITIGGGTVVHPRASIIAEGGPIIIAEYCIIEEYASIIHKKSDKQENPPKPLFIGAHNVLEVGCKLESIHGHVGESNVLECKSFVGEQVRIGSGCVVGAGCRLTTAQTLADNTVVWGSEHCVREALEKQPSQLLQLDFLSKVMPNYHRLRKPNVHNKRHSRQPETPAKS